MALQPYIYAISRPYTSARLVWQLKTLQRHRGQGGFAETLLDGFPAVERVAWTQLHNTSDSCVAEVYERAPDYVPESTKRVLKVSAGVDYWRLARDAVREQCGVPVQTWYEIIDGEADIQTVPRDETPY